MKLDTVVERIQPVTTKIQENTYVKSVTGGFMAVLPFLMFGALCSLIVGFPVTAWTNWIKGNTLGAALQFGYDATYGLFAVFVVIAIGYTLGRQLKQDVLATAITSLASFALVLPFSTTVTDASNNTIPVTGVLPTQWLGAQGIITALLVALVATRLYAWISDRGWKIKMPSSVPPAVSRPFESVVPAAIVLTLFLLVHVVFAATSYEHLTQFIYQVIGLPLGHLGNSFWAWAVILLLGQICWSLGIHNIAVWGVVLPIFIGPALENQAAGTAGQALPYVLTMTFVFSTYQWIGGPGSVLGLSTNMVLFGKSQRYKTLGRLGFGPSIFNIIEPIMFGFPIVFNPLMIIPFILIPLIHFTLGYLLISAGIIGVPWVALSWSVFTMPFIPGGFILGAGIGFGLYFIACYLISVAIWYPFFRVADRREVKVERDAEARPAAEPAPAVLTTDGAAPATA